MTMSANQAHVRADMDHNGNVSDIRPTLPAISGRELRDLLDPVSPETFFAEYWERKPLFIKGGINKLERLFPGGFTTAHFFDAVHEAEADKVRGFRLWAQRHKDRQVYIRSDQIEAMIAAGSNIATEVPSDRRVATFVAALKSQLGHPGDISYAATLSPADHGWPVHVDRSINFSIQCEGRKLFAVSEEPVLQWPVGTISFTDDGAVESFLYNPMPGEETLRIDTSRRLTFEAEPGDVIYWPAGTLHTTRALSDLSLTLHFVFNHQTFLNLFSRFLLSAFVRRPEWRHLPSPNPIDSTPGQTPAEVKEFIAARLREASEFLEALNPDSLEFNREWHKLLADPGEVVLAYLFPTPNEQRDLAIEPGDVLRLSKGAPLTYTFGTDAAGERSFYLYFADKELSVSGEWVPFLQTLVRQQRFTAASATQWSEDGRHYPWETVQSYLQALRDQGILECEAK